MPNYNDNNTRDNSIDQLPRMIFQLPNTESGATSPTVNPVFFCQQGCSIDYNFSNIRSCQFNNDGKKFTITPTDTTNINYIMWNGTDINSGEKMTQFTLKEVYFTAPAKDYLGINTDFISQSIQYYFVFVNEKYNNLMICVSVIGSVNNLGNAPKSNGFVMMETLATRIPSVNVQSQLNNLNNFNLGTLIPPNKPFFNTLITNNIQYIIITEVVDVPNSFFSNMVTMVNGGTQLYNAKMNRNRTNIPQNPATTILFYNENSKLLNDNQNFVCNSNCDLVPGKKITPSIGTLTTTESAKRPERTLRTVSGAELPPEKCETKDVWKNQSIKLKPPKDPRKPSGTIPNLKDGRDPTFVVALTVAFIIILVFITFIGFFKYTNKNKLSIIFLVIGLISIIVGLSVGCSLYTQKPETYWISYVLGILLWLISLIFLGKFKNYDSYGYGPNYSSFNLNTSPTAVKQQPYSGITVPTGFNQPQTSWFGKMFSSSDSKPTYNYSSQITVPTAQNTQPKQSFFDRMFKKSPEQLSATVPQSSVSVPSSMTAQSSASSATVPSSMTAQSSAIASSQPSKSFFSKFKDKFSTKTGSTMNSVSLLSKPVINKISNLIDNISRMPNNKINATKKKSLINKLNRISSNPSTADKILNEVNRELNTK
jgi:hypothetical protein